MHMFIHFKRVLLTLVLGNDGQRIDQSNGNLQQQESAQRNRFTHKLTRHIPPNQHHISLKHELYCAQHTPQVKSLSTNVN